MTPLPTLVSISVSPPGGVVCSRCRTRVLTNHRGFLNGPYVTLTLELELDLSAVVADQLFAKLNYLLRILP